MIAFSRPTAPVSLARFPVASRVVNIKFSKVALHIRNPVMMDPEIKKK